MGSAGFWWVLVCFGDFRWVLVCSGGFSLVFVSSGGFAGSGGVLRVSGELW
jgi:hypothetical protein